MWNVDLLLEIVALLHGLGLRVLLLVALNLVLDSTVLVLLQQQPKHFVQLFTSLKRDFKIRLHALQFFLEHLDALDACHRKLGLV